ncbi:universal stress protein [Salinirubellus sp. GCM10025818]|uniref:universal stress protein n=1 Tax=Salinirubellus TaxID=2162630 RepID=UPI0030CDDAD8
MYDRILVPTDGSDVADAAAEAAIAFADRFDAELCIVHVLELGELPPGIVRYQRTWPAAGVLVSDDDRPGMGTSHRPGISVPSFAHA